MAQSVAHLSCKQVVEGSSPFSSSQPRVRNCPADQAFQSIRGRRGRGHRYTDLPSSTLSYRTFIARLGVLLKSVLNTAAEDELITVNPCRIRPRPTHLGRARCIRRPWTSWRSSPRRCPSDSGRRCSWAPGAPFASGRSWSCAGQTSISLVVRSTSHGPCPGCGVVLWSERPSPRRGRGACPSRRILSPLL